MKILVLGDIHGRDIWKNIINDEKPELTIFLGDYISTHEDISAEQQLSNLVDILNYKQEHSDNVILLRGNHDLQHLGYSWAECSGFDRKVWEGMRSLKTDFEINTQWIYIYNEFLFAHAGVSQVWLGCVGFTLENLNEQPPSEKFAFNGGPWDVCGTSITQPCTWIRPQTLALCAVDGYTQIVGHTPVKNIFNVKDELSNCKSDIWLCDALAVNQYITIVDGEIIVNEIQDNYE